MNKQISSSAAISKTNPKNPKNLDLLGINNFIIKVGKTFELNIFPLRSHGSLAELSLAKPACIKGRVIFHSPIGMKLFLLLLFFGTALCAPVIPADFNLFEEDVDVKVNDGNIVLTNKV